MERTLENINMVVVNLTPHDIVVYDLDGKNILATIKASGTVARVNTDESFEGNICTIPVVKTNFSDVFGVPEPKEDTYYLVSRMVKDRLMDRSDVLCPDTGKTAIRYTKEEDPLKVGQIKGVIRFTY